ncbi:MAG TPA: PLDc N-terminal domain-containing protein [Streptosporangiaceae bacterium]
MATGYAPATSMISAAPPSGPGAAPVVIVLVLGLAFVVYCLVNLARAEEVRYLPRWAWAIICIISIPLGGILYLVLGKER